MTEGGWPVQLSGHTPGCWSKRFTFPAQPLLPISVRSVYLPCVIRSPAQGNAWMETSRKTQRWKSYPAYNVFIFRHLSSKVSEERQLSGMIKAMNQEESMKPNVKNMGRSCGLEYNQLGYPFRFRSIPKLYLFQLGKNQPISICWRSI